MGYLVVMETEKKPTVSLCDCIDLEHAPTCPDNPDPHVCEDCAFPFDPDLVIRSLECEVNHCDECGETCFRCTRFAHYE